METHVESTSKNRKGQRLVVQIEEDIPLDLVLSQYTWMLNLGNGIDIWIPAYIRKPNEPIYNAYIMLLIPVPL